IRTSVYFGMGWNFVDPYALALVGGCAARRLRRSRWMAISYGCGLLVAEVASLAYWSGASVLFSRAFCRVLLPWYGGIAFVALAPTLPRLGRVSQGSQSL